MPPECLSIQLFTMRSLGSIDAVLDAVSAAGYSHVETVGSHLERAVDVRKALDTRGLKASSSHVNIDVLRTSPEMAIAACQTLGISDLFMPGVAAEERDMPAEGWKALGAELGRMADRFQSAGIRLGYHNHDWELRQKDGAKTALELLFESAGASPLTWQVDVAWLVRGKVDPEAWIARYADRVVAAHVKDMAPAGQNLDQMGWTSVGAGTMDWRRLWSVCRQAGAKWMIVEHDMPSDPAEVARASMAFLKNIEADQ